MAAAMAVMAGFTLLNGINQAQNIEMQGKLQQQINSLNAEYADIDAYEAEKFGEAEAEAYEGKIEDVVGDQRVALASADIDVNFGTAAELQAETRVTGFLNAADIAAQGRARALGLRREAGNIRLGGTMQGIQTGLQAASTRNAAVINAGTTLASGYSKTK